MNARRRGQPTRAVVVSGLILLLATLALLVAPGMARAQEETNIPQLEEGQALYLENCSGCHQPTGVGLPPQIPPLLDNPNIEDAEYVSGVIMNGLSGEIEVNGQVYDGVMPSFPTLDDVQIDAIIAFIQNDLMVPGVDNEGVVPEGPVAGTSLPPVASALAQFGYLIVAAVVVGVLAPRVMSVIGNRGEMSTVDVGLKSAAIVIYFIATTVLLPSFVLQTEVMSRLPQGVQDFVAATLWLGALAIGILGLWWAQRQDRI